MKAKTGFIVINDANKTELFGSIEVITPSTLSRDIRKTCDNKYPGHGIKSKLIDQMAEEMVHYLNGTSIPKSNYEQQLVVYAETLNAYTTITLTDFMKTCEKAKLYDETIVQDLVNNLKSGE